MELAFGVRGRVKISVINLKVDHELLLGRIPFQGTGFFVFYSMIYRGFVGYKTWAEKQLYLNYWQVLIE